MHASTVAANAQLLRRTDLQVGGTSAPGAIREAASLF